MHEPSAPVLEPYLQDSDFTLYNSDAREALAELPDESVHMCVTSPPFFGLRDYGTGTWEGGDAECDHKPPPTRYSPTSTLKNDGRPNPGAKNYELQNPTPYKDACGKCGATRIDRQIGLEATPEEWVAQLVAVFEEVRRVLRSDGTLWVECGDSYKSTAPGTVNAPDKIAGSGATQRERLRPLLPDLKSKDLIGQPFLLAFALREAGWYWRNVCIWHKPNPMPESVRDRFTVSHSYVLLFSKSPRYFFDAEAVREPYTYDGRTNTHVEGKEGSIQHRNGERWPTRKRKSGNLERQENHNPGANFGTGIPWEESEGGRNCRSVWTIPTKPLADAHYAAFPETLAERCIKAGTSERGCCPDCRAPWKRIVESETIPARENWSADETVPRNDKDRAGGFYPTVTESGWRPSCRCGHEYGPDGEYGGGGPRIPIPCTVFDPFLGSGTTALVARRLGRHCIGSELSETYCELIARRTQQLSLMAE